jgi:MFS family permease
LEPLLLLLSGVSRGRVIGGFVVDVIGMKRLLIVAFIFHLAGIVLTIFAGGYWTLFISTL